MSWTTFTALGVGPLTTPALDANFNILSGLVAIPCTVTGTNTLVLTSTAGAGTVSGYANYMRFSAVAVATNSGAVTATALGFGTLAVYKDSVGGPIPLGGSEIVQNCSFSLIYDSTLNSSAGGFHLDTAPAAQLNGQPLSVNALTVAGPNQIVRFNSTLATVGPLTLTPQNSAKSTISLAGAALSDNIILGLPSLTGLNSSSLVYNSYVSAAGSVVMQLYNPTTASTMTVNALTIRVTNIGWFT